jgi:hypothetical protein
MTNLLLFLVGVSLSLNVTGLILFYKLKKRVRYINNNQADLIQIVSQFSKAYDQFIKDFRLGHYDRPEDRLKVSLN